jgi:hypothetical protein
MSDTSWLPRGWQIGFTWVERIEGDTPALTASNGRQTVMSTGVWGNWGDLRAAHLSVCAQAHEASQAAELEPLQGAR